VGDRWWKGILGQGPAGAKFTFDVAPVAPTKSIDQVGVDVAGTLQPYLTPFPPYPSFGATLAVTGAGSPLTVNAGLQNSGATTITGEVGASALTTGAPCLTVTASFSASGLTSHGQIRRPVSKA
jgi:hypothetical protein